MSGAKAPKAEMHPCLGSTLEKSLVSCPCKDCKDLAELRRYLLEEHHGKLEALLLEQLRVSAAQFDALQERLRRQAELLEQLCARQTPPPAGLEATQGVEALPEQPHRQVALLEQLGGRAPLAAAPATPTFERLVQALAAKVAEQLKQQEQDLDRKLQVHTAYMAERLRQNQEKHGKQILDSAMHDLEARLRKAARERDQNQPPATLEKQEELLQRLELLQKAQAEQPRRARFAPEATSNFEEERLDVAEPERRRPKTHASSCEAPVSLCHTQQPPRTPESQSQPSATTHLKKPVSFSEMTDHWQEQWQAWLDWCRRRGGRPPTWEELREGGGSKYFLEGMSNVLIILNTIFMVIQTEFEMDALWQGQAAPPWIFWGALVFAVLFSIEMVFRISSECGDFFRGGLGKWNVFDLVLVVLQVVEVFADTRGVSFLRVLRVFRAVRTAKFLRTLQTVDELRLMVAALARSLTSLFWLLLLLFMVVVVFSMLVQQILRNHIEDRDVATVSDEIKTYYGQLVNTMLSLFMAVTGGKAWHSLMEPLLEFSLMWKLFFFVYVVFISFGLLNIVTAVFVESVSKIAQADAEETMQERLRSRRSHISRLKRMIEQNGVNPLESITKDELTKRIRDSALKDKLRAMGLSVTGRHGLFELLDTDEDGQVKVDDLVYNIMLISGGARTVDLFAMMNENKKIHARISELARVIENNFVFIGGLFNEKFDIETPDEEPGLRTQSFRSEGVQSSAGGRSGARTPRTATSMWSHSSS